MQSTIDDFCQSLQRAADAPIDEDIMEYVRGFIDDLPLPAKLNTMESLQLELIEFLGPLLPALQDSSSLDQLCHQFLAAGITDDNTSYPSLNDDSVPTAAPGTANGATIDSSSKLALPIRMQSMDQHMTAAASAGLTVPKRTGDISLTNWRDDAKPSLVDQRKLERAEQKLKDKQQKQQLKELRSAVQYVDLKQDTTDYYAMNTMLDPHAGKGKPKDIRLENFDISFGGRKILSGANLTLAHGRRYGLIGRNGIGKSTLGSPRYSIRE
jgi:ATP-binding cassette subfamily F protein 3